jgi:branched-chain amino acid transport system ATP-binding protein
MMAASGKRPEALLSADSLAVGYGRIPVLNDVTLTVGAGEVVALLGPNGAGKTTLVLALSGVLRPQGGFVSLFGDRRLAPLHSRARRGLAFIPEDRGIIRALSTRDNLRLGGADLEFALDLFPELRPLLRRSAGLLSGGEQQILTVARALATKPKILLADELSFGLAPLVVDRLLEAIRKAADGGVGVLLVEQHVERALDVADHAYVLRRGRVLIEGPAASLRERLGELESAYLSTTATPAPQEDKSSPRKAAGN